MNDKTKQQTGGNKSLKSLLLSNFLLNNIKKNKNKNEQQIGGNSNNMTYSYITDPYTNIKYNINSKDGKILLNKYLMKF